MVNTLKIPYMCAEGVGRLRCVEIFLCTRPLQRARSPVCGTCWGNRAHQASDKSKASKVTVALEEIFRIQVHCKRLTVPETA